MIPYHGTPMTPESAAAEILAGRHALVSFATPEQIVLVAEVCRSFILDNGAFTFWKNGAAPDWQAYLRMVLDWHQHPAFDWCLIPDVIDGTEEDNDDLLRWWEQNMKYRPEIGVPVWHLHESLSRLQTLATWHQRIAIGSSGEFATIGTRRWWSRMAEAMTTICQDGKPETKIHGLRMLDPEIFTRFPFSSADSSHIARSIGIDSKWTGSYRPATKASRGIVLAERVEALQSAPTWDSHAIQNGLFHPLEELEEREAS